MEAKRGRPLSFLLALIILEASGSFRVLHSSEAVLSLEDTQDSKEDGEVDRPLDNLRILNSSEIVLLDEESPGTMEAVESPGTVEAVESPGTMEAVESPGTVEAGRAIDNFRDNFNEDPFSNKETRQGT